MANVKFKVGTQAQYDQITEKDPTALYWLTDTHKLYKGDLLFAIGKDATQAASGLLSAEDKRRLDELVAAMPEKVDRVVEGTKGRALIFNEQDGGGAKFEGNDGTASFVGVNENTNNGIGAQLYDINVATNKGAKLDVTRNGMFYTVGDDSALPAAQRDVEANEIATKKDVAAIAHPEYSMRKDENPGDYAAVYHLTKDGADIGEAINIAKDQLLKSVEVKTCTQKDIPMKVLKLEISILTSHSL